MKSISALCIAVLLLTAAPAYPQETTDVPTDITSDRMDYQQADQRIIFEGNVKVDRPDLELWAKKLTVFLSEQTGEGEAEGVDPAGDIEKIIAEGDVRIEREGRIGTCQQAVYDMENRVIVMEGSPVLMDGKNRIQGEVITFYLAENRSEVAGGEKERVKARFFSPSQTKEQ